MNDNNILLFRRKHNSSSCNDKRACDHPRIKLNRATRTLLCLRCGEQIDPFDHCWRLAETGEQLMVDIRQLKAERDKLKQEVAELYAQKNEKNKP
ncbi:hypothetical protein [Zooshikella ganghwensis]|uniref:Uncharacterized protein n=1 Tax=Zooshikella ganghwensis TaxID=202772 RepID=A0A4P9VG08_9GAMM|nr:hypothetical protein [Zooshikella ganghwensis]RDH41336.1 hypothetical protein B9G39_29135 [Zooshikella ganghwensis]